MTPEKSYVLLDREVLVHYSDGTRDLLPACLLVTTQADNWRNLTNATAHYNAWKEPGFNKPFTDSESPAGNEYCEVPSGDEGSTSEYSEKQTC